eukprot:TRINITY_DN243_c1_g1_i3.p1 TRINITY_DN243_c1_g1~~TRINITY_DN243_c1_g1_i3.p1  ORF type:complete len:1196 (+),score=236.79 TRINITY_DN243_c1_g1_i3:5-3592(+)
MPRVTRSQQKNHLVEEKKATKKRTQSSDSESDGAKDSDSSESAPDLSEKTIDSSGSSDGSLSDQSDIELETIETTKPQKKNKTSKTSKKSSEKHSKSAKKRPKDESEPSNWNSDHIYFFDDGGKWGFLSQRARIPFVRDGKKWPSAEHYHQAMKFKGHPLEEKILKASTPAKAAYLGCDKTTHGDKRKDWADVREEIAYAAMSSKFRQNPAVMRKLLQTHPKELRFGSPKLKCDEYWGYSQGKGKNRMGFLLMKLRDELVEEKKASGKDGEVGEDEEECGGTESSDVTIEKARTGKARCRQCQEKIEVKTNRVGKTVLFRGRETKTWFHPKCYFTQYSASRSDVESWQGFDKIDDEFKDLVYSFCSSTSSGSSSSGNIKTLATQCQVEYSSSARSCCRWCRETIKKGVLRMGTAKMTNKFEGKLLMWHHPDCFFEAYQLRGVSMMEGFELLRIEEQRDLRSRFPAESEVDPPPTPLPPEKKGKKRKNEDEDSSSGSDSNKRAKVEASPAPSIELQKKVEEQSKKLWSIKDQLSDSCGKKDLVSLLTHNEMATNGSYTALLDRCTEGMLFGPPQKCPRCNVGYLEKTYGGMWLCKAHTSAWSRCAYWTSDLKRTNEFKVPDTLTIPFLKSFVFEKHEKVTLPDARAAIREKKQLEKKERTEKKEEKDKDKAKDKDKKDKKDKKDDQGKSKKVVVKGESAVDPASGLDKDYHVYCGEALGLKKMSYNVTLSMAEISFGMNSFYLLQLLERDETSTSTKERSNYYVFRKWGRVGSKRKGSTCLDGYSTVEEAAKNFAKIFEEKTGNSWSTIVDEGFDSFEKKAAKYVPIEIDYGAGDKTSSSVDTSHIPSKLPDRVQALVRLLFDDKIVSQTLRELEFDVTKMPLGRLKKSQILKGYQVLTRIQACIDDGEPPSSLKYRDLSNQFYSQIPHSFKSNRSPLINKENILKEKIDMLDTLMEICIGHTLASSTSDDSEKLNPVDEKYLKLKTDISPVEKDTRTYTTIDKFFKQTLIEPWTEKNIELQEVFQVARQGEKEAYAEKEGLSNKMLLWHGSRLTNYIGILSQGLRIAPPDAPASGYLFGKGLYFADMVAKSATYCRVPPGSQNEGILLLVEVALGKTYEITKPEYMVKPPDPYHSTKCCGKTAPDPSQTYDLDGVMVPLGKGSASGISSYMNFNEFIVYDTKQAQLRYILKVKFI